jgi:methionyl-tRNA formyltransferase
LHGELARRGADLMLRALAALEKGQLQLTPQAAEGVTYANKIDKSETRVDWTRPWNEVHNHCRGLSLFPGAWCEFPGAGRVKILRTTRGGGSGSPGQVLDDRLTVACGTGAVRLLQLQRAGKQPMAADEFLRGTPVAPATVLH